MLPITKNDIVVATNTIRTPSNTWFKGTRFVAETSGSKASDKIGLVPLDKNGEKNGFGISCPLKELDEDFKRTSDKYSNAAENAPVQPIKANVVVLAKLQIHTNPVGTRFVTTSSASSAKKKVQVVLLDENNRKTDKGFSLTLENLDKYFTRTTETIVEKSFKKGQILQLNQNWQTTYLEQSIVIEKDVRALVAEGGTNPVLIIAQSYDRLPIVVQVSNANITKYFVDAQPIFDPKLKHFGVKNLQETQGAETRCFTFDLTVKGKVVGYAQNNGRGGAHHVAFSDQEQRKIFKDIVQHYAEQIGENVSLTEDSVVDYYLNGYHKGFITFDTHLRLLQDFLGASCTSS